MTDIASLGVVVKPTGIVETEKQLESLTKAGAATEKQTAKIAPAMDKAAISAGQLKAATRGLPAQFTDIVTSLQAGQNPLQVLLQQGGQIKDQFGGAGLALRAMGGYVAALIGPFTLAAAAAAALAVAWRQGQNEATEFNKQLALTGNIAGTTAQRLQTMSAELSGFSVTQHEAAAALAEVASYGQFTEQQLRAVTEAAIAMQEATGREVGETVKEFAKLAEDPVKAVSQLNDKYHFLTEAVFDQIKALKEQGREQDAATLAIETFARTSSDRARQAIDSADGITKAWRSVGNAISGAFDELRNFGRVQTEAGRAALTVAQANAQLLSISDRLKSGVNSFDGSVITAKQVEAARDRIEQLKKIKADALLVLGNDPAQRAAARQAATQRAQDAAIEFQQEAISLRTGIEKLSAQRTELEGKALVEATAARKAGAEEQAKSIEASSKIVLAALDKQIKDAEEREKKNAPKKGPKGAVDPGIGLISRVKEQIEVNKQEQQSAESLTASERLRISVMADLERAGAKVSAARKAEIDTLLAELDASGKALDAYKEQTKAKENLATVTRELQQAEENRSRANEADLIQIGRGREAADLARRRLDIEREYADNVKALNDRAASERRKVTAEEEQALRDSRDRMLQTEENFQGERIKLLGDWKSGARAAIEDFAFEAADVAGATYDIFRGAFDGLSDVFADFISTGKADFRGFLDSVIADIASFVAKQQLSKWMQSIMGGGQTSDGETLAGIFDLFAGNSGGGFGFASGGYTGHGGKNQVAGAVHKGEYVINADATRALGRGYLDRLNAGQLPAVTGGGASSQTNNLHFTVAGSIDRRSADQIAQETGRKLRTSARNG